MANIQYLISGIRYWILEIRYWMMKSRVGVYICHCGINIAATVDVEAVTAFAQTLPNVAVARNYTYMCSDPGQELIKKDIREHGLTHVVVASCSPRMHEPTFRGVVQEAGINPYCFEMANIREQCSWVHQDRARATEKAKQLVASAVAKAALLQPLEEREVGVTPAALVIGGGIADIEATLDIANAGFKVYLVEKEPTIGGRVAQLNRTFPTLESCQELLSPRIKAVAEHPNVVLLTSSEVVGIEGYIGNFQVTVLKSQISNLKWILRWARLWWPSATIISMPASSLSWATAGILTSSPPPNSSASPRS